MRPNITELVVQKELCIGCGVCAALCPASVLKMKWSKSGIYEPFELPGCLSKCRLCLDVCSFYAPNRAKSENIDVAMNSNLNTENTNLDNLKLKFDEHFGYFYGTYEFYRSDDEQRIASASGGAGSFALEKLFELGLIDRAICAIKGSGELLYEYKILDKDGINGAKKSAYYPLCLDEVLSYVIKNDLKFAITALPCYAASLRLAMAKNAKLRNRIKFIIVLVCGQNKSKFFAQHSANLAFKKEVRLKSVDFREKISGKSSMEFSFKFEDENGKIAYDDRNKNSFLLWSSRAFTPLACNSCTDVFGKFGDLCLMDAWLEDKITDYKGHSLLIAKHPVIDAIFKDEKIDFSRQISPNLIIFSQAGVVKSKLEFAHGAKGIFAKIIVKLKKDIQRHTNKEPFNQQFIDKKCAQILKIQKLAAIMSLPKRAFFKFIRIVKERC